MMNETLEKYKGELIRAHALAGFSRGTRAGFFTGLALDVLAVVVSSKNNLERDSLLEFAALTTGIGAMLGTAKGLYVGAEKKADIVEREIRNSLEVRNTLEVK